MKMYYFDVFYLDIHGESNKTRVKYSNIQQFIETYGWNRIISISKVEIVTV